MERYCVSKYEGLNKLIVQAFQGKYFDKISQAVGFKNECENRYGDSDYYFEVCDLMEENK